MKRLKLYLLRAYLINGLHRLIKKGVFYLVKQKNLYLLIFIILLLSLLLIKDYLFESMMVNVEHPLSGRTIVIDPGHGGIDPGKVGLYGKDEKYINLEISLKLKKILELSGAQVVLTREDNEGLYIENVPDPTWVKSEDMLKRRQIIQESDGDLLVSIHMNSYPDSKIFGAQTFYLKGDEMSEKLGKLIQEELVAASFRENTRQAKSNDSYFILKENGMPSVVVECGFLSNIEEEQKLNSDEYQEDIAWAIMKGIVRYFYEES